MGFEPNPELAVIRECGPTQPNETDIQFTNYPSLRIDDLILEIKPEKLWKISRIHYPEKNRSPMLQYARISQINRSDIEYKIDVPEDRRKQLIADLDSRRLEREF
jgi:hypothetical protein